MDCWLEGKTPETRGGTRPGLRLSVGARVKLAPVFSVSSGARSSAGCRRGFDRFPRFG